MGVLSTGAGDRLMILKVMCLGWIACGPQVFPTHTTTLTSGLCENLIALEILDTFG